MSLFLSHFWSDSLGSLQFIKKSYPMPWQVELIDEEIEILRKGLKEDEIRYEAKAKRLAENTSLSESFNKNNRKE